MQTEVSTLAEPGVTGLRDRKKARRHDDILAAAQMLFARQGIDATTMADIADACGISVPTVFNYFGTKDGILIAIIDEGTRSARAGERAIQRKNAGGMADLILPLFSRIAAQTLAIAGKRVWRYAEAAVIRHPDTEFSRTYRQVGVQLIGSIAEVLQTCDLTTRTGTRIDPKVLATILHDLWMPCFIRLITEDDMTPGDHDRVLRDRLLPLVGLLFDGETQGARI